MIAIVVFKFKCEDNLSKISGCCECSC